MIKQNDRRPYLTGTVRQPNGAPANLTNLTAAFLIMRKAGDTQVFIRKPVVITDAPGGRWQYIWQLGDTATTGNFDAEIELQWGNEPQTVPVDGYYRIIVLDDLDSP